MVNKSKWEQTTRQTCKTPVCFIVINQSKKHIKDCWWEAVFRKITGLPKLFLFCTCVKTNHKCYCSQEGGRASALISWGQSCLDPQVVSVHFSLRETVNLFRFFSFFTKTDQFKAQHISQLNSVIATSKHQVLLEVLINLFYEHCQGNRHSHCCFAGGWQCHR